MKKQIGGNGNNGNDGNFCGYGDLRVSRGTERFIELPGGKKKRRPKDTVRKESLEVRLERRRRARADTPDQSRSSDKRRNFHPEA